MCMNKYQIIVHFTMDDDFMVLLPAHRTYINFLMNKGIIETYAVSMETQTVWITMNAENKEQAAKFMDKMPLYKYWQYSIETLFMYDSTQYRLPTLQLN